MSIGSGGYFWNVWLPSQPSSFEAPYMIHTYDQTKQGPRPVLLKAV